jgi:isoleucyl-tRNA synthetase
LQFTKCIHDFDYATQRRAVRAKLVNACVVSYYRDTKNNKEFDLHRPYVDDIRGVQGGGKYVRIPEVLDPWLESGSMPYAQVHYPFENKEKFEASFPADYVAEYV